jgi:hypothetical protein
VADIWGFAKSTEKLIGVHQEKTSPSWRPYEPEAQISATAKVRRKSHLRERLQETPETHSRKAIISPGFIENLKKNGPHLS